MRFQSQKIWHSSGHFEMLMALPTYTAYVLAELARAKLDFSLDNAAAAAATAGIFLGKSQTRFC